MLEIDETRMRLLVSALKSGQYPQVKGVLTQVNEDAVVQGHCCLGVACEVAIANGLPVQKLVATESDFEANPDLAESTVEEILNDFGSCVIYDGHAGDLPLSVSEWYGFGLRDCDAGDVTVQIPQQVYDKYNEKLMERYIGSTVRKPVVAQATMLNDSIRMSLPDIGECFQYTYLREDWEADHAAR